jgi:hypothetical protein
MIRSSTAIDSLFLQTLRPTTIDLCQAQLYSGDMSTIRPFNTSLRRWTDRAGFAISVVGVIILGWIQGSALIALQFGIFVGTVRLVILSAALACFNFAGFLCLSGVAFLIAVIRNDGPASVPRAGPTVDAIVPVYHDAAVLHRSVESLLAVRYADVQVTIVCEPDDTRCIQRAQTLACHDRVTCLVNRQSPARRRARSTTPPR